MKLTHRLTILYVILSVAPMLLAGYLAYTTGQKILIAEIHEHLQGATHHKIAAVNFRIADSCRILESLANNPLLIQHLPTIQTGQTVYPWPESYRTILTHHLIPFLSGGHFDELFIMDPVTARIMISTNPRQEGKLRQFQPYFTEGKHRTHVQNAYFSMSLESATMVIGTPVMDDSGQLLAVMAGRLNMKMLTDIMRQDSPNGRVEDSFLVNRFNFFVTEPWFGKDMALHQTLYNDVINSGLAGRNGVSQYVNYRNQPVIGMVQWIPEREMCMVTEISHSEAMTPIHRFGQFIFQFGLAMAIISAVLVWLIARSLIFPIKQLVAATARIGSGELDIRIGIRSRDEIGELAGAFNRMTHQIQETLVHRDRLQEEISKRQETENSLRSSEERHRDLLAGTTDLVLLKDNLLRYRLVNPAVGEFFRHPAEFLIGKTDAELMSVDVAEQCRKSDEQAIREHHLVIGQEVIGDQIFETRKFPVRMPDGTMGVGTFIRDVTQNVHHADRIVQLNLVLRALRDLGKVFLLSKTEETLIHDTCDQLISHRRYQGASIILLSETGIPRLWAASGVGEAFEPLAEWLKQGHLPPCCELVFTKREARLIPDKSVTCSFCPIATDCLSRQTYCLPLIYNDRIHGSLSITVGLDSDIDDEEKFLLEMAAGDLAYAVHNLRLEQEARLAEGARQKTLAQMQQVQKMEALGTLAGGIAHDFNNILGIIVGYAELAGWQLNGESPLRNHLNEILTACQRARDLIAQILTFSRKSGASRHPVQVHLIIREVLRMLRASLPSTIDIRSRIDSKAVVNADPAQIHQILMNLCTNASHAMQDHGGELLVELTENRLTPDDLPQHVGLKSGLHICLVIQDTGHGIDPDIIDRIFDPFFTTKEQGVGTGLGLSVVHGIVTSLGGEIRVSSNPDTGARFQMLIPASQPAVEAKTVSDDPLPMGNETILLVDDETLLIRSLGQILTWLGYQVSSHTDSHEALATFMSRMKTSPFDLVITDMTMPKMDGLELIRRIRSLKPEMPVLLCTGNSEKLTPDVLRRINIQGLVMKPVTMNDLAHQIRNALKPGQTV